MAKRSIHNADLSRKYTPRGRHYNDARAAIGHVRSVADAVLVHNFDESQRFNDEMRAIQRANPVVLSQTLHYHDAQAWPDRSVPEKIPASPGKFVLTARPPVGMARQLAVRARFAAIMNRTGYISGI